MSYYFIRHGESQANADQVTAGQSDSPLTKKGLEQARLAGQRLKLSGTVITSIVSSPLSRAYDTACLVAQQIGYPLTDVECDQRLVERGFGTFEGQSIQATRAANDDELMAAGVEPESAVVARAVEVLKALRARPEDTVLVVAHNGIGRRLFAAAHHTDLASVPRLPNAEVVELSIS